MRTTTTILAFLVLSMASYAGDWEHTPKSSDYAVREVFKGKPAPVKLSNPRDRMYRTVLRTEAKKGPDFAGHYRMVVVGCGLDSFFLAVVDAHTGDVYWPPFGCITLAGGFDIPLPEGKGDKPNPAFRLNSRLFVIVGVEDTIDAKAEDRSAQFWVFDQGKFKSVYSIPAAWEPEKDP
jgi:hypothetical protein